MERRGVVSSTLTLGHLATVETARQEREEVQFPAMTRGGSDPHSLTGRCLACLCRLLSEKEPGLLLWSPYIHPRLLKDLFHIN